MKLNPENTFYEISQSHMNSMKDSKAKFYFAITIFVIMNI